MAKKKRQTIMYKHRTDEKDWTAQTPQKIMGVYTGAPEG